MPADMKAQRFPYVRKPVFDAGQNANPLWELITPMDPGCQQSCISPGRRVRPSRMGICRTFRETTVTLYYSRWTTRFRSRSSVADPYICRSSISILSTCPSTGL